MDELKITAVAPGDYTFRQGDALPEKASKSINIVGTLPAPFDFLSGKIVLDAECHLKVYKDLGKLELVIQDTNPHTTHTITGQLHRNNVLESFKLNTDVRWGTQQFLKFIKTMRYYFPNKDQHAKLVESLQKWSAKIETVLKEHQDASGNSMFQLEKKVSEVALVRTFDIEVAIFQGYPKERFQVEIGLDPKSTAVDIYLISDTLIELEIGKREAILAAELKKFDARTFSKVVVS